MPEETDPAAARSRNPFADQPDALHPLPGPPQLANWRARLLVIDHHVGRLLHHRTIWRTTKEIVEGNPRLAGYPYLFAVYTEHYFAAQAVGIRRQSDSTDTHHQTLGRLLVLIEDSASDLTREWYCSLYPATPLMQSMAKRTFDDFSGPGQPCASPEWFSRRRELLGETTGRIRRFVNRRVAHVDSRDVDIPRTEDLDDAIDTLGSIVIDLHLLLEAVGLLSAEPIVQWDWTADLRVPWVAL